MEITITLTAERYDALTKTAELHLPKGTPEEYLQNVIDSACDSYAQTNEAVAAQVYKDKAAQEAAAKEDLQKQLEQAKAEKDALMQEKEAVQASLDSLQADIAAKETV